MYESKNNYEDYLEHHGVKGMKWGVRRYQNEDGSYTQKGLQNYRESEKKYHESDKRYKEIKQNYKNKNATKLELNKAKNERKIAKSHLNRDYDQLKLDKKADKGKLLYQQGKTIKSSANSLRRSKLLALGGATTASVLARSGKTKPALYVAAATVGLEVINGLVGIKNDRDASNLRAYYAHNRNYRKW